MNSHNYTRPPRKGVIVFVSFVFAAILGVAFFSSNEQRTDLGHSVHLSPTSANYGTVSMVRPQGLAVPMQSTVPMLSGGAIRSYAYSGHATMPKGSSSGSGFKMYTTSSAIMHSIGSGGGGGSMSGGSSQGGTSSKGIQYGGGSVSVPSLALVSPTSSGSVNQGSAYYGIGRRRVIDNGDGTYTGEYNGEYYNGLYWSEEAEDWVSIPPAGTIKEEDGVIWEADGLGGWVQKGQVPDLGTPVGDAPWHWMLLLALVYISVKVLRKRMTGLSTNTID